jgi:hypothetical protein
MIVGIKGKRNADAATEIARIKADFGVANHYLEDLLQQDLA